MNGLTHLKQLTMYFLVGVTATIVEWIVFYLLDVQCGLHYTISVTTAFALSTLANWGAGRILVFKKGDAKGIWHEFLCIYAVSGAGLGANLLIMWVCIDCIGIPDMIAKIIATGIMFVGNFAVRKFWIYKS